MKLYLKDFYISDSAFISIILLAGIFCIILLLNRFIAFGYLTLVFLCTLWVMFCNAMEKAKK